MRLCAFLPLLMLFSCGDAPQTASAPKAAPAAVAKPADETRRFPGDGRVSVEIVDHVLGKGEFPPANVATYQKGAKKWTQFLVRSDSPEKAAVVVLDLKTALAAPKFVAHMGGYSGMLGDTSVFLFPKGKWVAGITGLSEQEADTLGRQFALRLD